jgi:hypothetical protein
VMGRPLTVPCSFSRDSGARARRQARRQGQDAAVRKPACCQEKCCEGTSEYEFRWIAEARIMNKIRRYASNVSIAPCEAEMTKHA